MSDLAQTNEIVTPAELATQTDAETAAAGERVAQMCATEAWADLRRGIAGKQAGLASFLMGQPGDRDRGALAKIIGEMAGVALIDVVAKELIAYGEKAAQEIRAREEGF